MKVINSKLAAIGLAAFVFASCSDSENGGEGNSPIADVAESVKLALTESDVTALQSNVVNYKNTTANARKFFGTRAANNESFTTTFTMPTLNEGEAQQVYAATDIENNTFYLKGGDKTVEYDFRNKTISNATVFVKGGAKLIYDANTMTNATIVVLQGGSLQFNGTGSMIKAGNTVYNELGSVKTESNNTDIVIEGNLYSSWRGITSGKDSEGKDVEAKELKSGLGQVTDKTNPTQKITFKAGAKACIIGSIRATDLTIEEGANVYASAHVMNATNVNLSGNLEIGGFMKTADFNVNANGYMLAGDNTAIKVTNALTMNGGTIDASYINVTNNTKDTSKKVTEVGAAQLALNGKSKINLAQNGVINVNKLVTDNAAAGQITLVGGLAVVKADEFHNNSDNSNLQAFATPAEGSTFLFQFSKCFQNNAQLRSAEDIDVAASYLDYDKATTGDVVEFKDQDNTQYGYQLKADVIDNLTANPSLDLFSASGVKETSISATSIQAANGKLYTTYHTYGNGNTTIAGGLEVSHINGNQLIIDQKVNATDGIDINHGMLADSRFYVAATTKKEGALLGYVAVKGDGTLDNTNLVTFPIDKTTAQNGIDANCVVKYDNSYVLATNKGYQVYNNDLTIRTPHLTDADVKHLAVAGGNLYSLEATGTANGTVKVFNNANLENPQSFNTGKIAPADAKNVITVDGSNIYVCQGEGGLVRYNAEGAATTLISEDDLKGVEGNYKGRVNGVAVDANYVYVACGSCGLIVLDKATGKQIARRRAFYNGTESLNSANYVTVDGQNICVAYGKSRVQIFRLKNTQK